MRRGQSLVVWAIREGRQAAHAVDEFLMGSTNLPRERAQADSAVAVPRTSAAARIAIDRPPHGPALALLRGVAAGRHQRL